MTFTPEMRERAQEAIRARGYEDRVAVLALFVGDVELYSVEVAQALGRPNPPSVSWAKAWLVRLEQEGVLTSRIRPRFTGCLSGRRYYRRAGTPRAQQGERTDG